MSELLPCNIKLFHVADESDKLHHATFPTDSHCLNSPKQNIDVTFFVRLNIDKLHVFYMWLFYNTRQINLQTIISCTLSTMIDLHFIEVIT